MEKRSFLEWLERVKKTVPLPNGQNESRRAGEAGIDRGLSVDLTGNWPRRSINNYHKTKNTTINTRKESRNKKFVKAFAQAVEYLF